MAAVGPRHKGMSLAAAAAPADVLTQLFQLCLAHPTRWGRSVLQDPAHPVLADPEIRFPFHNCPCSSADTLLCLARLRLVCKHWRDCVDGLELEVRLGLGWPCEALQGCGRPHSTPRASALAYMRPIGHALYSHPLLLKLLSTYLMCVV